MPLDLDPPISNYFATRNAGDAVGTAALFAEDGRVHDERHDHRGRSAIQGWAEETSRQYQMVQTPRTARQEDGATVVTAEVAGSFPGSPIELSFRFVVDGQQIKELQIG